jgi:hypothetical protein
MAKTKNMELDALKFTAAAETHTPGSTPAPDSRDGMHLGAALLVATAPSASDVTISVEMPSGPPVLVQVAAEGIASVGA